MTLRQLKIGELALLALIAGMLFQFGRMILSGARRCALWHAGALVDAPGSGPDS